MKLQRIPRWLTAGAVCALGLLFSYQSAPTSGEEARVAAIPEEPGGTSEEKLWEVLLLVGVGEEKPAVWDGRCSVAGGELHALERRGKLLLHHHGCFVRGVVVRRLRLGDVAHPRALVTLAPRAAAGRASRGETERIADAPVSTAHAAGLGAHEKNAICGSD